MRRTRRHHLRRMLWLIALLGLAMTTMTGCLRVHVALAVSQDDLISGDLVVAALPNNREDKGPTVTVPPELSDKVRTEPYAEQGYVGQRITLSNVRFADLTLLVDSVSAVKQYRMSFRRSGDLVSLAGSIDLTQVPPKRSDVQIKVAFPGQITRTNGDNTNGTITWAPKPGAVTEFDATAQYSDSSGVSWTQWVAIVGGGAVFVAMLVVLLALLTRRRTLRLERAQAALAGR